MSDIQRRQAARSLVLSGSLERRLEHLERLLPSAPVYSRAGAALVPDEAIRRFLVAARRQAKAKRYAAAVSAYETAEALCLTHGPAIAAARRHEQYARRETAASARGRAFIRAGNAAKQRRARGRAARYVRLARGLRKRRPEWTLSSIIAEIRRRRPGALSARQIRRYLAAAGLT